VIRAYGTDQCESRVGSYPAKVTSRFSPTHEEEIRSGAASDMS
jgi:hypothetical protein